MSSEITREKHVNPWWVAVVSGMASYIDSCAIISSGIALVIYQNTFGLTNAQFGMLSAALTFCIAIGSIFGGRLGDRYGRKPVFSVTMVMLIVGALLLIAMPLFVPADVVSSISGQVTALQQEATAANKEFVMPDGLSSQLPGFFFPLLLLGQLLLGFGVGADLPVSLATIAEEAPDDKRGKMLLFSDILWVVGIVVAQGVGALVGDWGIDGGMIMFGQLALVSLIVLIARQTIPESPVWIKAHQDRLAGKVSENEGTGKVGDLLKQPYAVPFIALVIFYIGTNVPANTLGQFSTWVGTNVAHLDISLTATIGLIVYPIRAILDFVFMKFVDTDKRMPLFYGGAVLYLLGFLMFPLFGASSTTYVLTQLLYCVGAAFAFEGILKVWMQECFPTLLRTTANGTIVFASRFLCAVSGYFTASIIVAVGYKAAFGILAAFCLVGFAAAIYAFHGKRYNAFEAE